jgi:hypothetical protein
MKIRDYLYTLTVLICGTVISSAGLLINPYRFAAVGGGGPVDWIAPLVGGIQITALNGETGFEVIVGGSNVTVTHLAAWIVTGTYQNVDVKIRSNASTVLGSVTVPISGATVGAYRWVELSPHLTLTASTTYYLMRNEGNYNAYPQGSTTTYTSSAITAGVKVSETCLPTGDGAAIPGYTSGANLRYTLP